MPLNLVQVQERLKDVPMQVLMQYANGSSSQVPPYLALGELNRRKQMQESETARIAKESAGAPTIKQQIEQAAGLLALQGSRQQQAAEQQQGVQALTPMAAPNTVTSEPAQLAEGGLIGGYEYGGEVEFDPSEMEAIMMGMGGVGSLPTNNIFVGADYAGGGIVAFNGEEESLVRDESPIGLAPWELATEEDLRRYPGLAEEVKREVEGIKKLISGGRGSDYYTKAFEEADEAEEGPRGRRASVTKTSKPAGPPVSDKYREEHQGGSAQRILKGEDKTKPFFRGDKGSTSGIASILPGEVSGTPTTTPSVVKTPKTTPEIDFLRKLYQDAPMDYEAELKKRGLDVRPQTGKELDELRRQLDEYAAKSGSFTSKFLALEPGRKGIGGGTIGKSVAKYEADRMAKLNDLRRGIAKAEDLDAKAQYEFNRGNFDAGVKFKTEADKERAINANRAGTMGVNLEQIAAQREGVAAQRADTAERARATNLVQLENAHSNALRSDPAIRSLTRRLETVKSMILPGTKPSKEQLAEINALQSEIDLRINDINKRYEALKTQQGGGGAGEFKVIGVKPGAQ